MSAQHQKRGGPAGRQPLSAAARKRALAMLQAKADAGDIPAAEALVRLSLQREATQRASQERREASP